MKLLNVNRFLQAQKRIPSLSRIQPVSYKTGQVLHDYEIKRVVDVPEFFMTAIELEHTKTGSLHFHLSREDKNNVFNVGLQTTPMNSTGVAHVLEHVTLCGSAKFPVRDPFFKMLNRSMSSFMNAMTGADYTMYPFSTQNPKDYKNLMSVYLDSVFFPRIRKMDFLQEGWRLEHEKVDDSSSPIIFKGVVFNEMKGMMADPTYLYGTALQNKLLPDHTYGFCSGGKPMHIPNLTWEDLKNFHATHYHPSNARFITYGDIPLENHLEQINEQVMKRFDRISPETDVPPQLLWSTQRSASITCPPDVMAANPEKQTTCSFSYLLPEVSDVFESFVAYILCALLIDGPSSPFYKTLIESGFGTDYSPNTGCHGHMRQAIFSVGLQGIGKDSVNKVEELMENTIDNIIRDGFSKERIESMLHKIELQIKHQSSMFGLGLTFNIIPTWQHGADPVESLQIDATVAKFRQRLADDPEFLQKKGKEYFKTNKHRLSLVMYPDEDFQTRIDDIEKDNLKKKVDQLNQNDRMKIFEEGKELLANQHAIEDLSCLPTLHIDDIPKIQEEHRVDVHRCSDAKGDSQSVMVTCTQPTNGLTYFNNVIPIDEMSENLKPYVPLFCDVLTQVGTESTDYITFSQLEDQWTGGLSASVTSSGVFDAASSETYVRLNSHCLDRNTEKMFDLWQEIFYEANWKDETRLRTLIRQSAQELANGVSFHGHLFAMRSAAQSLTPCTSYNEIFSGLTQVKLMKDLAELEDLTDVQYKLRQIGDYVLRKNVMTHVDDYDSRYALHSTPASIDSAKQLLNQFNSSKPNRIDNPKLRNGLVQKEELVYNAPLDGVINRQVRWRRFEENLPDSCRTFYELPLPVNYVSMCVPTASPYACDDSANLKILARLVTTKFLHREIREKGGAYGGGAKHGDDGVFRFYSYRDPNHLKTVDAFKQGIDWLASGSFTLQDVDEAKLAVFQAVDAPVSPCNRGMTYFLDGLLDSVRQRHRDNLLQATKDQLVATAQKRLQVENQSIAVVGPADEQLKEENWKEMRV